MFSSTMNIEKTVGCYLKYSIKVLYFEMWWKFELVANVIAALSSIGDVDSEDQCLVPEGLYAVHHLFRQLPVSVHIQLEPAVTVGCCRHDLLH